MRPKKRGVSLPVRPSLLGELLLHSNHVKVRIIERAPRIERALEYNTQLRELKLIERARSNTRRP